MFPDRCLFTDFDGVIRLWKEASGTEEFDHTCIGRLNKILLDAGAHIVIISNWRKRFAPLTLRFMLESLHVANLPGVDQLCVRSDLRRGDAIMDWLKTHPSIERWNVLDDETRHYDGWPQARKEHLFSPNGREGLQDALCDRILARFRGVQAEPPLKPCADDDL